MTHMIHDETPRPTIRFYCASCERNVDTGIVRTERGYATARKVEQAHARTHNAEAARKAAIADDPFIGL